MFEMILLNIDDAMLYQQHDFTQQVRQELKKPNIPYAVHIATPKLYNLDSNKDLPVFVSVKENNIDNKNLNTNKNGYLIFSNNRTADIYVKKTFQDPKERPLQLEVKVPVPSNAPPGWVPPKTTYYKSEYRLLKKNEIPNIEGTWTVTEHSGKFISNPQTIKTYYNEKNSKKDLKFIDSPFLSTEEQGINTTFLKSESSPILISHEFNLKTQPLEVNNKQTSIILNASFSVNKNIDISRGYFPIHIIISGDNIKQNEILSLKIPKDNIIFNKDSLDGYFSIDLMPTITQKTSVNNIIGNLYITFVAGESISKIYTIVK